MRMRWMRLLRDENLWHLIALVGLFALAIYLHTVNLAWNPGWYPDEGSDLDIARNLAEGRGQYFAITGTPLIAARVPLFHILLIGAFSLWGYDILAARLVVALVGLITTICLYGATRQMLNRWVALLAAFIATILPNALTFNRMAFAYNLQALFVVVCWWALWKFSNERHACWLWVAAFATGAAYLTALTGLALIACVGAVVLWYSPRRIGWVFLLMVIPGMLYLGVWFFHAPDALAQDLGLLLNRTGSPILAQLFDLVSNFSFWLDWTWGVGIGIVGLFLLQERRVRNISLLVFFMTLVNAMRMLPGELSFHRYLELLPLLALGAANFVMQARRWLAEQGNLEWQALKLKFAFLARFPFLPSMYLSVVVGGLLIAPLLWMSVWNFYLVSSREAPRATRLDSVLATKPSDAVAVTDFVNRRVQPTDLVLASPAIAWRIQSRTADYEQMLAFDGAETENYGLAGVPRSRFVFEPTLDHATYIILDHLWHGWALQRMPPLKNYLRTVESWQLVLQRGEYTVYRNPAR